MQTFVIILVVAALDGHALELLAGLMYGRQADPGPANAPLTGIAGPSYARILTGAAVVFNLAGQQTSTLGQASRRVGDPESPTDGHIVVGAVAGQRGPRDLAGAGATGAGYLTLEAVTGVALQEEARTVGYEAALDPASV